MRNEGWRLTLSILVVFWLPSFYFHYVFFEIAFGPLFFLDGIVRKDFCPNAVQ